MNSQPNRKIDIVLAFIVIAAGFVFGFSNLLAVPADIGLSVLQQLGAILLLTLLFIFLLNGALFPIFLPMLPSLIFIAFRSVFIYHGNVAQPGSFSEWFSNGWFLYGMPVGVAALLYYLMYRFYYNRFN